MYNNHDTDQMNVYANRSAEARFAQTSNQSEQGRSEKIYHDDNKNKGHNSQETDSRFGSDQTSREDHRSSSGNVSPATIEHSLRGMKYPAEKKTLIEQARSNSASEDVMSILDQFEEKEYSGVVEVNKEIGRVESNKTSRSSGQNSNQSARGSSQKTSNDGNDKDPNTERGRQETGNRFGSDQTSREDHRSSSGNVSPATIEHSLRGMKYPAEKKTLIEQARSNSASEDVMSILDQFEEKEYSGVVEVNKEIGRVESNKT